jgi:hypothetical protein
VQLCATLAVVFGGACDAAAQALAHVPRIGILFIGAPSPNDPTLNGLVKGLRDLAYDPGETSCSIFDMPAGGRSVSTRWRPSS